MKAFSMVSLVLALAGCSGAERGAVHEAAKPCNAPETIEAYCANHACPTFDEHAANVRKQGQDALTSGALFRYEIGTCGSLKVITTQNMSMGFTYYDASGHVVAINGGADTPICEREFSWSAGTAPTCTMQVTERGGQP
jgi:hypothetical protein